MKKKDGTNKAKYFIVFVLAALILIVFYYWIRKGNLLMKFKNVAETLASDWAFLLLVSLFVIFVLVLILIFYDNKKMKEINNRETVLKRQIERDSLTGAYNMEYLKTAVEENLIATSGESVLIMFDVDGLKVINETFGHEIGDRVLQTFAQFCMDFFTDGEIVSRISGDEFAVYLPKVSNGNLVKERLNDFFNKLSECETDGVFIHCYAGLSLPTERISWAEMFKQASTALYIAKRSGKNRYVLFKKAHEREQLMSKRKMVNTYTDADRAAMDRKEKYDVLDAFVWIFDIHKLNTAEEFLLENNGDLIMIVDSETKDIVRVLAGKREDESVVKNWIGKKCYEAYHGMKEACANCLMKVCNHNSFVLMDTHSETLEEDFIERSFFINMDGKERFVHVLKAVSSPSEKNEEYKNASGCQNLIATCSCSDVNSIESPEKYFEDVITALCIYYGAEKGYITRFSSDADTVAYGMTDDEVPSLNYDMSAYARKNWKGKLGDTLIAYIKDIEDIARKDERMYDYLKRNDIRNLVIVPLWDNTDLYGYVAIHNITRNETELPTAGTVGQLLQKNMKILTERENTLNSKFYDATTGYLNFDGFKRCMRDVSTTDTNIKYALCAFDVIKFKYFNEVFGYDIGDIVLNNVADMFARMLYKDEFMCRISSDNFCALCEYETVEGLMTKVEDIVNAVSDFFRLNFEGKYLVELAAGIYPIAPGSRESVDTMLNMATIAKKRAKQEIGGKVRFYDDELKNIARREIELESNMDEALRKEEFHVFLQPQVYIGKYGPNSIVFRAEALCRWVRNNTFYALPSEFIPLFEHDGRIAKLDMYMLDKVCSIIKNIRDQENISNCFAVNVSRATLLQPDFLDRLEEIIATYGIFPGELELEFTEGIAVTDYEKFVTIIDKLKELGCYTAMDDFGSEFSSLNVLQNLPVDVLKLDKKFFEVTNADERHSSIVRDTINMARNLDMRTIAEGIEDSNQVNMLRQAECDFIQGYVYAKPMPVMEYVEWTKNYTNRRI